MLERYEAEAFLALAEELHFGRAAERLRVSTARVSQTIRRLERRVGVALFARTSRRVELLPAGRALYEDLRPAWDAVAAAVVKAVDAGRGITGVLRVCFTGAQGGQLLVDAAELFRRRHPECAVEIREAQTGDWLPWLRAGVVDVALAELADHPGIARGRALVSEARFVAVPVGHPFAGRSAVSVAEVDEVPGPVASTFQEALTFVGAGRGVLTVGASARRYYARPDVAYVHLVDAPALEWGLLWRSDAATARVRAFASAAADLVRNL